MRIDWHGSKDSLIPTSNEQKTDYRENNLAVLLRSSCSVVIVQTIGKNYSENTINIKPNKVLLNLICEEF